MKINQIVQETTTSGSVAPVEHGFVKMQTRNPGVYGNTKAGSLFKGKKTKAPYANSINEGAMKQLSMDLKAGADGLSDQEFQKKYKMTKQEARKELTSNRKENNKPQPVSEAHLEEDDIILVPGQGRKMKTGFVPHGQSRVDHEVEMARSDLFSAAQNAQKVYSMIKDMSEEEGLEGWVQEKIIKANDYLNTIREYLEGKQVQGVAEGKSSMEYVNFSKYNFKRWEDYAKEEGYEIREAGNLPGSYAAFDEDGECVGYFYNEFDLPNGERYVGKLLVDTSAEGVAEGTGDVKFDKMLKGITGKKEVAKQQKTDTKQQARDAFGGMFGGGNPADKLSIRKKGVAEGAKVDRMVKHIAKSEKKLGKSKDEAENIAWATANKRGMLDNKNKKA